MFRRRAAASTPAYYRGVPVVNLLSVENRRPLRVFGAEGRDLLARAALLVLLIAGAAVYVVAGQEADRYAGLETDALRRATNAGGDVTEAETLVEEIETLKARGSISQRDFDYLKGEPRALIAAIQSVISLRVTGVDVLSIESEPPDQLDVQVRAARNVDALEWRRLIGVSPGVDRVLTFESTAADPLVYDVRLVSGAR